MSDFKKTMQDTNRAFLTISETLKKWVKTIDWKTVHERMEYLSNKLPNDLEQELIKLMNRGWFIWLLDGTMSDFSQKIYALMGKSYEEQDAHMRSYVKANLGAFEAELCKLHPSRESQIQDAFRSHVLEIYYASIPTLLALSEGIGRDLYPEIGIFAKHPKSSPKAGHPKTDDIFDSISGLDMFEEAVLKPLRVSSEVTKSIYSPTEDEKKLLNRHLIIHGNSNSYGSEDNSLKAISLVFFIHKSLEHLKSEANT